MKTTTALPFLTVLILSAGPVGANAMLPGAPKKEAVGVMEVEAPRPSVVFSGACSYSRNVGVPKLVQHTIYLVMPAGRNSGFLADVVDNGPEGPVVPNFGYVKFRKGRASVEEHMGGMGTNDFLRRSVQKIAETRMKAFPTYAAALSQKPMMKCPPELL